MKTKLTIKQSLIRTIILISIFFFTGIYQLSAQSATLKGRITDEISGEAVPFAIVLLEEKGEIISGTSTNIHGVYELETNHPGSYNVMFINMGYHSKRIEEINIAYGQTSFVDGKLCKDLHRNETAEYKAYDESYHFLINEKDL